MIKKIIITFFVVLFVWLVIPGSFAVEEEATPTEPASPTDLSEILMNNREAFNSLQDEYEKLEEDINKNKEELFDIQSDINKGNRYISGLNSQINVLNSQLNIIEDDIQNSEEAERIIEQALKDATIEINDLSLEISALEPEIARLEKDMEADKDDLLNYIKEEYISGNDLVEASTIDVLFSSKSMEDYFTKAELIRRIQEIKEDKFKDTKVKYLELSSKKAKLEEDKSIIENNTEMMKELEVQRQEYLVILMEDREIAAYKKKEITSKKEEIKDFISVLDEDSDIYKEQIKKDREDMAVISAYIDAYIGEYEGSTLGEIPEEYVDNDGRMSWPVTFNSYVSCGYPNYSDGGYHGGIDICAVGGNSYGRPFHAAQSGKVILSYSDDNWNGGLGNYCVIDHGDGTYTLYAHASGIVVSQGDVVRKGEHIGYIGKTGNVTGPHLHFEVRVKNSNGSVQRVNPLDYVSVNNS